MRKMMTQGLGTLRLGGRGGEVHPLLVTPRLCLALFKSMFLLSFLGVKGDSRGISKDDRHPLQFCHMFLRVAAEKGRIRPSCSTCLVTLCRNTPGTKQAISKQLFLECS